MSKKMLELMLLLHSKLNYPNMIQMQQELRPIGKMNHLSKQQQELKLLDKKSH